jgi:DNA-binding transcriptional LysR family regulator
MLHSARLRYLDAIVRCGSIRAAASELNVASSAVNRQLLALEDRIGAPLFERLPRGIRLTAVGEIVIEHVRATLKDEARVMARIGALRGSQRGAVTIAVTPGLADGPMPEIISQFIGARPSTKVGLSAMRTDQIASAVVNGEVDLGLGYYMLPNPALRSLMTLHTEFGVVVAPGHPLARRSHVRFSHLLEHKLVLTEPGSSLRQTIDRALLQRGITVRPDVETNSIETLKRLVAGGDWATLLNPFDASSECRSGRLVFKRLEDGKLSGQLLCLVARSGASANPLVNLFVEELRTALPQSAAFMDAS